MSDTATASSLESRCKLLLAVCWLALTVYFFNPPREAFDHSLDRSNYATYAHFAANLTQWGETVLPMTGPLGFVLYGSTYSGDLFWVRIVADLALKGVFVALLLHLFLRAGRGSVRWVWLAGVVWLVPVVDDLFHDFAILTAALCVLVNLGPRINRIATLATITLGFLALFKGTHFITTALCFGAVLLQCAWQRQFALLLRLVAIYLVSIITFWMLARQNPANIPLYLRGMLELSSGYNATMGLDELPIVRAIGLAVVTSLAGVFLWSGAMAARSVRAVLAVLLLAGFSFIKWKHGFLRADGHVTIFFTAAAVVALTLALVLFTGLNDSAARVVPVWRRRTTTAFFTIAAVWSAMAAFSFQLDLIGGHLLSIPTQLAKNAAFLAAPGSTRDELEHALARNRREADVPQIRNEVGKEPVDFFGYEQGLLLLNGLTYQPRPMGGGSFNVFTPWLQRRNEAFVQDPRRAPKWQVMRLLTLDERLPAADDGLALRAILNAYTPVLMQRDYLLLRRREDPAFPPAKKLETVKVTPGKPVTVPAPPDGQMLLFTLEAPLSLFGKARNFVYRAPTLGARFTTDRQPFGRHYVLKPIMLREPAILSPLLSDNTDIIDLFGDEPGNRVRSIELLPDPGFATEEFTITFYTAPRPPPPEDGDIAELKTYIKHPLHNRAPDIVNSLETGIRELNKEPITSLHAPGSLTWNLRPEDQQFIFSYGLMPQTYLNGGTTDGVEFTVEVLWPPNDGRVLFKHMLRPRRHAHDQGMQRARVFLPPFHPGAQLRVRTHPGQDNNAHYDQSYVTRIQIKSGPLVAEQFNGLGVVPASRQLPAKAVAAINGQPVYLVHAPDEVAIPLPAGSRAFSCEIGLLPTAFEQGGNSDGVQFRLELVSRTGTRATLAQKLVDPRNRPEDRRPQRWTVELPALTGESTLILSTHVGAAGDRSWDQSYVRNVEFR